MGHLVLVRGLPGSGKSTFAQRAYPTYVHEETDKRMYKDGVYVFQPEMLAQYHHITQLGVKHYLSQGRDVVVSNTFTKYWELDPYLRMEYETCVVYSLQTHLSIDELAARNVHGCPAAVIQNMKNRWEVFSGEYEIRYGF
jgi:predicted kinase